MSSKDKVKHSEFNIVREFTHKLGLPNRTDGSLFIYKGNKGQSTKPDGYYFYEGITFILDAKSQGTRFSGQIKDYMRLESNANFIGFEYNGVDFRCYVGGKIQQDELSLQDKDYYRQKYFPNKINNEFIVNKSAKKLANLFRDSKIDKQMNVPFIGASMLCMKFNIDINLNSTETILNSIKIGINTILDNNMPITKRQKKEFILKILGDSSLKKAKIENMYSILQEIATIYNFINISADDYKGHDIMNNFLKVFRRWNSANANEKGEVFTPDHIANLMYSLALCTKDNTILDPTCGSGTFLTNAMANMFNEIEKSENFHEIQKSIKEARLIGIESNEFNVTLAGINMILHGDSSYSIYFGDCFSLLQNFRNLYDRVLMNPPFSQKDIELKFVYETLKNMKDGGILASILPKPCVKGTEIRNVEYLEKIFEIADLKAVVSLPSNLFYPVGANTCIIVLQKSKMSNKTILINCLDDGFEVANKTRADLEQKWETIKESILNAYFNGIFDEYRAVVKYDLKPNDELLFEAYNSHRPLDIEESVFARYLRENISAKILCNFVMCQKDLEYKSVELFDFSKVLISDLIEKVAIGNEKSIKRTLEDKYNLIGIPLIIAKQGNNGVGGMIESSKLTYKDKICIITGGDGGGGKTYYCDFEFCATNFVMICDFKDKLKQLDKFAKFYISVVISERLYKTILHGRTINEVPNINIKLPIDKNGILDSGYMSNFIKRLNYAEFL